MRRRTKLVTASRPKNGILEAAHNILEYAIESAESLLFIYDFVNASRGAGRPTTEDQDLLRAMVVFAGAGLDAALKQVAQDAQLEIVGKSRDAQEALVTYVERRLLRSPDDRSLGVNAKEIASLLLSISPRGAAVERLVREIRSQSLQSYEELQKAAQLLGASGVALDKAKLREAFEERNRIVHEMDMDVSASARRRKIRRRTHMVDMTRILLQTAHDIVARVDEILG